MTTRDETSAIVIGASMAGLVTARVLSEHVDRVTVLERDDLPDTPAVRRGVPQGRHAHVLLAAGQLALEGWFPGLSDKLVGSGAVPVPAGDVVWHQAGGYRVRADLGFTALSMSRPLLEDVVRDRLLAECGNVSVTQGVMVDLPLVEDGRVVGVLVDGEEHRADLVVDCSGRNTQTFEQLAAWGFPMPDVSSVSIDMAYRTRVVRRRPGDLDRGLAVIIDAPGQGHRMGVMVPIEDDRWTITVGSFHGDTAPTDPDGFEAFARSLPSPEIAAVLARSQEGTPAMTYRMRTSQRRHVERLRLTPPGILVLGDAICSFNPVYGQGMSSAALQARALGHSIARHGLSSPELGRAFYRRAAKVVDVPWQIAAAADFADPHTTGTKRIGTDLVNRYLEKVYLACHTSVPVLHRTTRVQNLVARPGSLMTPRMVLRVLLAARRSRVARGARPARPAPVSGHAVPSGTGNPSARPTDGPRTTIVRDRSAHAGQPAALHRSTR